MSGVALLPTADETTQGQISATPVASARENPAERQGPVMMSEELEGVSEFGYRPMPAIAPVALVFGMCSAAALLAQTAVAIAAVGVVVGWVAWSRIRRAQGELGGGPLALTGLALSTAFLLSGSGLHAYQYITEVPEGHRRINFNWLSSLAPEIVDGNLRLNPQAEALNGQRIFIKGYMYPTRQVTDIESFVLCKDSGDCCFGGQPKLTDMIIVDMQNKQRVSHRDKVPVGVAGILRAEKIVQADQVVALYRIECTHFR